MYRVATFWPVIALLFLLSACQREASAPPSSPPSPQASANDTAGRQDVLEALKDAQPQDPKTAELQALVEKLGGQLRPQEIHIALVPESLFVEAGADLRIDSVGQSLRPLADLANKTQGQLQITAHVDATGDPTEALDLSKRRADAVADFLQLHGVAPDRLHTSGMGAAKTGGARIDIVLPRPAA